MNPDRQHPPTLFHRVAYTVVAFIFRLFGWRATGTPPDLPKFVLIFGPHTSYVDNYLLAAVQACYQFEATWLAAEKLFRNPLLRVFLLWVGARPVDRSQSHRLVDQYVTLFRQHDHMILGIAPAGTRKKRDHWKSGFYWIALEAGVPIVCLSMDYKTRRLDVGLTLFPSGDIHRDMEKIAAYYAGKVGRRPARMTPVSIKAAPAPEVYGDRKAS